MKAVISTPSGREVSFAADEKVRLECQEDGEYWLMLCADDGQWLYKEKHDCFNGKVIQAQPAKNWEFSGA